MPSVRKKTDRLFLYTVAALTAVGFVIFLSASLGLLAGDSASFSTVALKQGVSLLIGITAFFVFSRLDYHWLKRFALFILIGAIALNLALFIPGVALSHGGAARWINLGFVTFQPSEFLKIAVIIYIAAWARFVRDKVASMRYGLLPYIILMAILSAILLSQPDTDTLVIIAATGLSMLIIAGMRIRHVALGVVLMAVVISGVVYFRPYAADRIRTFIDRGADASGTSYQINQSLIAIGSGSWMGRGFGQSVQKFGYLPEPIGDSIFAVAAEEFGFVGGIVLVFLYVLLAVAAFRIGVRSPDIFGGLLSIGIAILIVLESFMNMAAMLGLIPLSGLPLLFVSHGGTALIIVLAEAGMVANVSKHVKSGG